MTEQVKTIKNVLSFYLPAGNYSVRIRRAGDYARSSDTITVETNLICDEVISVLKRISKGIVIDRKGKVLCKIDNTSPIMYDPVLQINVDFDLCEFIEVGPKY